MKKMKNQYTGKALRYGALALSAALAWQVMSPSMTHFIGAMAEEDSRLSKIYGILSDNVGDPETAQDYYEMANISIGKGEYETALQQLETARRLLMTVETAETGEQTEVGGENAAEQPELRDAATLSDDERTLLADICLKTASVYILTDKLDEAQTALDETLEFNPDTVQALILRAQLENSVRNEAIERFASAVPCAEMVEIPGVKHEIYRCKNSDLLPYFTRIFEFLGL